jgi:lactate racemase
VSALDYLVALGTHPIMSEGELNKLVGVTAEERAHAYRDVHIFNHRWDLPEALHFFGMIPAAETRQLSGGLLDMDIPVAVNKLVLDYDQVIICGPTFPHEVIGFSGGNKYLFPGIAGPDIINATHWLGALMTSMRVIGVSKTPVRDVVNRAASLINVPIHCISLVMHGAALAGLYIGKPEEAYEQAAELSARINIVYVDKPFTSVLSMAPKMYDDMWTAAKAMYKLEPVVADGGELIVYAPHITEVSYTHGKMIDQVGYHTRDYFVKQINRFQGISKCVLAHSTHLKGFGSFEEGVERPRINIVLATGIPEERCRRINLGYMDPNTIHPEEWANREHEGILLVRKGGEVLYRLRA